MLFKYFSVIRYTIKHLKYFISDYNKIYKKTIFRYKMIKSKEIGKIILIVFILTFLIALQKEIYLIPYLFLSITIIILINTLAKKITSTYLESEIEIDIWKIKRYWFRPDTRFINDFPSGIFFPSRRISANTCKMASAQTRCVPCGSARSPAT